MPCCLSSPNIKIAGITKTEPPTTIPEVAPIARMLTFSIKMLFLFARAENPTARMLIGIAVSIPCPNFNAMNEAAAENTIIITIPKIIDLVVTSITPLSCEITGTYFSPSFNSR